MTLLTKADLPELDRKIDSSVKTLGLLSQKRDVALIHLLRYFEDYVRLYELVTSTTNSPKSYEVAIKNGEDGMHFAAKWIFQYCPPPTSGFEKETREGIYKQAVDLHMAAMDYSTVWNFMAMAFDERVTMERDVNGVIRIQYANQLLTDAEMADRFIGAPDSPDDKIHYLNYLDSVINPYTLSKKITARSDGQGSIRYYVSESTFNSVARSWRNNISRLWEFGEDWDLGGYTVTQFRELWVGLITLCWIHFCACFTSGRQGGDLDNTILILHREEWISRLAKNSGLDPSITNTILSDLIYDINLYNPNAKEPDVRYQPFFPLHSDFLALSNWLVLLSNHERNIWDLVSIKRPQVHSVLRNKKEQLWLAELKPLLKSYGLDSYGPTRFSFENKHGDIDLLILDRTARFGLCCQLKWLTGPDRIRDVKYTENELRKGLQQAELSLKWVTSSPANLQTLTGLGSNELQEYEFKAMVLSKNTIGSGWAHKCGIPIVNERILKWILGEPHRKHLLALWQVGEERRYLPKRGKHFNDEDISVSFGNISFLGKSMGAKLVEEWNPAVDIDLTGLS